MKIGILDIGITLNGSKKDISDLISIIKTAEDLGFSRYWLGEHFSSVSHLKNNEILISILCQHTRKIKIGPAGILLLLNSPYRVSLNYLLLESLFPNRIDLGLARGICTPAYFKALKGYEPCPEDLSINKYDETINELVSYLRYSNKEIIVSPAKISHPPIWLLGQTQVSLDLAIKYRTNYCLSLFHAPTATINSLDGFKEDYYKIHKSYPKISLAVAGVCSGNPKIIEKAINNKGRFIVHPTVVGCPDECKEKIIKLKKQYKFDELIFLDITLNKKDQLQSYLLLSNAFNLTSKIRSS